MPITIIQYRFRRDDDGVHNDVAKRNEKQGRTSEVCSTYVFVYNILSYNNIIAAVRCVRERLLKYYIEGTNRGEEPKRRRRRTSCYARARRVEVI